MDLFIEIFQLYNEIKISDENKKIISKSKNEVRYKNELKEEKEEKLKKNVVIFELLSPIN